MAERSQIQESLLSIQFNIIVMMQINLNLLLNFPEFKFLCHL